MYNSILLPLDLSDKHEQALRVAEEMARASQGTITLLHIVQEIQGLSPDDDPTFYDRLQRKAKSHLERLGKQYLGAAEWRVVVAVGHRAPDIVRFAVEQKMDLVILTSPRFDPQHPTWGSMSYKVVLLCPCPVLLVK